MSSLSLPRDTLFLPNRGGTVRLQINILTCIFCHGSTSLMGLSFFIVGVSRLHSIRHAALVRTPPDELRARCRDLYLYLYLTTQHSKETDIHTSGGIQTRNHNKQHGRWYRPHIFYLSKFSFSESIVVKPQLFLVCITFIMKTAK
jgi:hypothetical protein